jgi:hypothetical protein
MIMSNADQDTAKESWYDGTEGTKTVTTTMEELDFGMMMVEVVYHQTPTRAERPCPDSSSFSQLIF